MAADHRASALLSIVVFQMRDVARCCVRAGAIGTRASASVLL